MAKGPKTLNPADKARKEARKKELKKNKKQRQQVRLARKEEKELEAIQAAKSVTIDEVILPPELNVVEKPAAKKVASGSGSVDAPRPHKSNHVVSSKPTTIAPIQQQQHCTNQAAPQSKPAVIESKPVIFIPKVTKFVPASVRSKLGSKQK